jgi:hypothetical protein
VNGDRLEIARIYTGRGVVGESGPGQSEVRGGVGVVGVTRAGRNGGGEVYKLYEPLESLT